MSVRSFCVAVLLGSSAVSCLAQLVDNPDWKEIDVPPPPAFRVDRLIPIEQPASSNLRFGVDPATISMAADGVVRYVIVASSSGGAMNALYEGIRCTTGEVRTYARSASSGVWTEAVDSPWRKLMEPSPSRHALELARTGVCRGAAPNKSVEAIVRDLRAPPDMRFQ